MFKAKLCDSHSLEAQPVRLPGCKMAEKLPRASMPSSPATIRGYVQLQERGDQQKFFTEVLGSSATSTQHLPQPQNLLYVGGGVDLGVAMPTSHPKTRFA